MNDKQIALFNSIKADMLSEVPEGKWSGRAAVPKIGETVIVWINDIGNSSVVGYWLEAGWIGLVVKPKTPPEWYVRQNGIGAICVVFGAEIRQEEK